MKKREKTKNRAKIKGERLISTLGYALGAGVFLMFFLYMLRQFIFPEGTSAMALAVLVGLCALIPLIVDPFLYKRLPRLAFALMCGYLAIAIIFTATFIIHLWDTVLFPEKSAEISELDEGGILIVFGSKIQGSRPARPLAKRLDVAIEIMRERDDVICIVTGGQGADEIMPEGEAMKNYMIEKGIAEDRIIAETEAHNTIANIDNSLRLIKELDLEDRELACVSTRFHIPRIKTLMKRAGVDEFLCFDAPSPTPVSLFFSVIREYCSRAKILFGR